MKVGLRGIWLEVGKVGERIFEASNLKGKKANAVMGSSRSFVFVFHALLIFSMEIIN